VIDCRKFKPQIIHQPKDYPEQPQVQELDGGYYVVIPSRNSVFLREILNTPIRQQWEEWWRVQRIIAKGGVAPAVALGQLGVFDGVKFLL